jgi:hypothetical protein
MQGDRDPAVRLDYNTVKISDQVLIKFSKHL